MSLWEDHDLTNKIADILGTVRPTYDGHHLGPPYLSAYQIAIRLAEAHPATFEAIGKPLGGAGTGQNTSLPQYIAQRLSQHIKNGPSDYPIEGAFLSNEGIDEMTFTVRFGEVVRSSLVRGGSDLSLFRLRA